MKHDRDHPVLFARLPATLILSLVVQAAAVIVWATQLDARVTGLEQQGLNGAQLTEKFARLEERLEYMRRDIGDMKQKLDRIADRLMKP